MYTKRSILDFKFELQFDLLIVYPGHLLHDCTFRKIDHAPIGMSVVVVFTTLTDILFRLPDPKVTLEALETLPLLNSSH